MKYSYYLKKFWPLYLVTAIVCLAATVFADRAVTAIAESTPIPRSVTLIIDAGHGGEDGGATSCTGVLESQINLEIALRLRDLCHLLGYQTRMIRTSDVSIYTEGNSIAAKKVSDLRQRVRIVNETEDAILISIHQNTFPSVKYSGAQVFYNDAEGSKALAQQLQSAFVQTLNPGSSRKIKPSDGIYLMEKVEKTAILVECGFISNPEEEGKLRSVDYQQKICCVIVTTVSQFHSNT